MRRAKVGQIYRRTGDFRARQLLLGHTTMVSAIRYHGVEFEDALSAFSGRDSLHSPAASRAFQGRASLSLTPGNDLSATNIQLTIGLYNLMRR